MSFFIKRIANRSFFQVTRNLYSQSILGIDHFATKHEQMLTEYSSNSTEFKNSMQQYCIEGNSAKIFTNDLKTALYLANENDLDLIQEMLLRYVNQNKEIRFGTFIFGPVIMRMCYLLNKPDYAFKLFINKDLSSLFEQHTSAKVLMDLLFNNNRYAEVVEVFEIIRKKQLNGIKYPKYSVLLTFASLYKMNTPDSFQYAKNLWNSLNDVNHIHSRRSITLFAGLALLQNVPEIALELLSNLHNTFVYSVLNLNIQVFSELNKHNEIFNTLNILIRELSRNDRVSNLRLTSDTMDRLQSCINRLHDDELLKRFNLLLQKINSLNAVENIPLSDHLLTEIKVSKRRDAYQDYSEEYDERDVNFKKSNELNKFQRSRRNFEFRSKSYSPGLKEILNDIN